MWQAARSPSKWGSAEELKTMAERQELEPIERSASKASALLVDARRSLKTCRSIAQHDPKSALPLAWDGAAFPTLTAALALAGYRVTNRIGHHRVAVEATRLLLDADPLMSRIGSLRRVRARGMYEMDQPEVAEVTDALDDCEQVIQSRGEGSSARQNALRASGRRGSRPNHPRKRGRRARNRSLLPTTAETVALGSP